LVETPTAAAAAAAVSPAAHAAAMETTCDRSVVIEGLSRILLLVPNVICRFKFENTFYTLF